MSGVVVWFTGLPASGKSTLAQRVRQSCERRRSCVTLDSDDVREVLGADGYDPADRDGFYRVLARLAVLLARQGHVVLVPATAPRRAHRELARAEAPAFLEVHVETPLDECERRDPKGLYAQARAGAAPTLPGVGAAYEPPEAPDVTARGGLDAHAAATILEKLRTLC